MAKRGKKSSLKSSLQSQQSRLKRKQKAQQAAQVAEQSRKRNPGQKRVKGKVSMRTTNPFNSTDKILLIGEGNFSFARALLSTLPPSNITATAYDSEEACYAKYPEAETIVQGLREKGVEVVFDVDATKLEKVGGWKGSKRKWDRVVWNFPHAGMLSALVLCVALFNIGCWVGKGIADQDRNILTHQILILGFLRSIKPFLATGSIPQFNTTRKRKLNIDDDDEEDGMTEGLDHGSGNGNGGERRRGTILITLRNVAPYTQWYVYQFDVYSHIFTDRPITGTFPD